MWGPFAKRSSKPGVEVSSVFLYQPEDVVASRVSGSAALAGYIHSLQELCKSSHGKCKEPHFLDIAVVIGSGARSRCWLMATPEIRSGAAATFTSQFERIAPPLVSAPLAFAIRLKIAGGGSVQPAQSPPVPDAWSGLAAKLGRAIKMPDDVAQDLWPDMEALAPVINPDFEKPPQNFVVQVLKPIGGRLLRPADWHYAQRHRGPTFDWIISKEDPTPGPYETGFRIQVFSGITQATGKSPLQFAEQILSGKRATCRAVHEYPEMDLGHFTRAGLLVEEGRFTILYSVFWGNKIDVAIVTIAGTLKEKWDFYSGTFDRMRDFELLPMAGRS